MVINNYVFLSSAQFVVSVFFWDKSVMMSHAYAAQYKPVFPNQPPREPETKSEGTGQEKREN